MNGSTGREIVLAIALPGRIGNHYDRPLICLGRCSFALHVEERQPAVCCSDFAASAAQVISDRPRCATASVKGEDQVESRDI